MADRSEPAADVLNDVLAEDLNAVRHRMRGRETENRIERIRGTLRSG